jgi:hypothetical protein
MREREMKTSTRFRMFSRLGLACIVMCVSTLAFGSGPSIVNADFSTVPISCGGDYSYQSFGGDCGSIPPQQDFNNSPGFGWTFVTAGGSGLAGPAGFDTPSFSGLPFSQAVFLQGNGNPIDQAVSFTTGGNYVLAFYLGSRYNGGLTDGNQTVEALIDGAPIGTWSLVSFTPFTLEASPFAVATGGTHTLEFVGLASGDHTAFFSGVAINAVPEPAALTLLSTGLFCLMGLKRRLL